MADLLFSFVVFCGAFVVGAIAGALLFGVPLWLLVRYKKRYR